MTSALLALVLSVLAGANPTPVATAPPSDAEAARACFVFFDRVSFVEFNEANGKIPKGIEDFEESTIGDFQKQPIPAPLASGVSNPAFPDGITQTNLIIQDNVTPGPAPPAPNPSGSPVALYAVGVGAFGSNSKKVGEDLEILEQVEASIDLIFDDLGKTAVGFELSHFAGFGSGDWHISIFDLSGTHVGTHVLPDDGTVLEPTKSFFGIWCDDPIGRINIWDEGIIPEAIDNIEMWVEFTVPVAPTTWGRIKAQYDSE